MAVTPGDIGAYANKFFNAQVMDALFKYLGYIAYAALILGVLMVLYFIVQYKFKVYIARLHYSPDGKSAQIIGWKKDRARTVKKKDGSVYQQYLFSRAKTHQFDEEDIIPKNKVFLLKLNKESETYVVVPSVNFGSHIADFETLNPEEKYWAILQLKENARTYADSDAQKRILTYTIVAVVLIGVMLITSVWLIMKQPARIADATLDLADKFHSIAGSIGGTPPG